MCLLSGVSLEKLSDDEDCGQKVWRNAAKPVFPPRSPLLKAEAGEPQMCNVMCNVQCPIIRCNVQSTVPLLTFKSHRSLKAAFGLLPHSNANSHSPL